MHDDINEDRDMRERAAAENPRDLVGELINAAGRRPVPPADTYHQVFAAAHTSWHQALRARQRRRWVIAMAAAAAAAAVGLTTVLDFDSVPAVATVSIAEGEIFVLSPTAADWQPMAGDGGSIVAGSQIRSGPGSGAALSISGSSSLRMHASGELTLESAGRVTLRAGTIYLDSGPATGSAGFEVVTPFGTVRDIGTQFEVASSAQRLRIRIREGAVELENSGQEAAVLGSAGEQISLDIDGELRRDAFSPFDAEWGWAEALAGAPEIEGLSLLQFLSWVARETGRDLRFDAPRTETRARSVTLHGRAQDLAPLQALNAMLATTDFQYSLLEDGIILVTSDAGAGQ
jgi:ferric-dicitrate binding protein FerR (iron transport regulator)